MNKTKFISTMTLEEKNIRFSKLITQSFLDSHLCVDNEFCNELRTIVTELITNAVVHSNGTIINLKLNYDDEFVYVSVKDNGIGIENVEKAKELLYSTKGEERAGLGFSTIEVFSDEMIIRTKPGIGTLVKVKKRLPEVEDE